MLWKAVLSLNPAERRVFLPGFVGEWRIKFVIYTLLVYII